MEGFQAKRECKTPIASWVYSQAIDQMSPDVLPIADIEPMLHRRAAKQEDKAGCPDAPRPTSSFKSQSRQRRSKAG